MPAIVLPHSIEENVALDSFTTLGVGGVARYLVRALSIEMLTQSLQFAHAHHIPFLVLGKGSNSLIGDGGFDGLVIVNKINFCEWRDESVYVGGGYSFARLGTQASQRGLAGLEFASGIPGSVGGAIYMNAGANGVETRDSLESIEFVNSKGKLLYLNPDEMDFSYRYSAFQQLSGVIVAAKFRLASSDVAKKRQREWLDYRLETQPYKAKTAGCFFRNPEGLSAGALIEACGLKGFSIGGAQVSLKHANFIENKGGATADEIAQLIEHIQSVVYNQKQIKLELEVKFLGST